ncbi:large ribosomal subunit protein bL21m isoform X1 [Sagmatias obliquidens]|uniref:large ribosomal subunit protein bL21m isoform X1 n=1 Tax=Sagmatias obliquidens TaxID=3371155 RepID=UPI000F43F0D5|nr:39S ribosomal protein L21, mitochondrial isoform X1 [Lagenorhynchus obliquidens]
MSKPQAHQDGRGEETPAQETKNWEQPLMTSLWSASRRFSSQSASFPQGYVPKTSLSSPPWPEVVVPDPVEEARHHAEVVEKVNELIARGRYGRLFAVVHFASHQWKVTSEDLILIENKLDVACGERIRLEKVRLSCWLGPTTSRCSADPSSGNVLSDAGGEARQRGSRHTRCNHQAQHAYASHCGKDLVQVEATVIEKTESWPKINMRFKKRKNYKRKRIIVSPQTILRINTIRIAPCLC